MKGITALIIALLYWINIANEGHAVRIDGVRAYGKEIGGILTDKIFKEFTAVDALENKYLNLSLQSITLNQSQILDEKVGNLKKILKSREELVMRVAVEAETLRKNYTKQEITSGNITFYQETEEEISTTNISTPTVQDPTVVDKLFYRNAKCDCGYQLPFEVDVSTCVVPENGFESNKHFGNLGVSYESSSVHIPTEVYNEDPEVLKDVFFSQGMSEILRREICNNESDSHLNRWVYFTTHQGVMRFFPDRAWSDDCERPDVYDSRTSPWFLQSVSSPKDVTMLIDNSGSVQGLTLNLFYRMVRHFMDTLSANDFLNIVLFNEQAEYISETCTGLLHATPRNKQILKKWLDNISTGNLSSFEHGFDLALKSVDTTAQADYPHANCNPIVVLFTDGGATYPETALTRWDPDGNKRVFTFAVGKNFYGSETTKEIACKNRGNFYRVPSFTATKSTVQSYLKKISEPLAVEKRKVTKWTLPYRDNLGLGLVISASTPVYDRDGSLGVVGVDLLLNDLKEAVTDPEMGLDFYPFMTDNNGFAVIHPNLIEESYDDTVTTDITELEVITELENENIQKIRQEMIDQKVNSRVVNKDSAFDGRYLKKIQSEYTYTYAPIEGTVFSLGIAIDSSKLNIHDSRAALTTHYPDLSIKDIVNEQPSDIVSLLYSTPCKDKREVNFNPCEVAEIENATAPISFEDGVNLSELGNISCDSTSQIYSNLLLHALLASEIVDQHWESNSTIRDGDGVLAQYTALETPSFLQIKFLNVSIQTDGRFDRSDDTVQKEITAILANPRQSTYLRRAIHEPDLTIYSYVEAPVFTVHTVTTAMPNTTSTTTDQSTTAATTPPSATTEAMSSYTTTGSYVQDVKTGYILATRAVRTSSDEDVMSPVVTGIVLHPDTFSEKLFSLAYKCNGTQNCSSDDAQLVCNDYEKIACLILDDGGFLISSNQEEHFDKMNKFFGLIDGEFMRSLIAKGVYDENHIYNHQAICETTDTDKSAGMPRYLVPTIADIISFGWWFSSCARVFLYSFIQTSLVMFWSLFDTTSSHLTLKTELEMPIVREQCILRSTVVNFGPNSPTLYGTFKCTEICERQFTSVHLQGTNLLLVVADSVATCREECSRNAIYSNEEVDVTLEEICANKTKRYRKPPEENCYDASTLRRELDSDCSSSMSVFPSFTTISFFVFLHFIICKFSME